MNPLAGDEIARVTLDSIWIEDDAAAQYPDLVDGAEALLRSIVGRDHVTRHGVAFTVEVPSMLWSADRERLGDRQWLGQIITGWWLSVLVAEGRRALTSEQMASAVLSRQNVWRRFQLERLFAQCNMSPRLLDPHDPRPGRAWHVFSLIGSLFIYEPQIAAGFTPTWQVWTRREVKDFGPALHWLAEALATYLGTLLLAGRTGAWMVLHSGTPDATIAVRVDGRDEPAPVLDAAYQMLDAELRLRNNPLRAAYRQWRVPDSEVPPPRGPAIEASIGDEGERVWRRADSEYVTDAEISDYGYGDWDWQLYLEAAEFVRDDPLESELRAAVDAAARSVPGVAEVVEEDREVWLIRGGDAAEVLAAVSRALDGLAPKLRAYLEQESEG